MHDISEPPSDNSSAIPSPLTEPQAAVEKSPSLLNKTNVRQYAFDVLQSDRPGLVGKITRVSEDFYTAIEAATRKAIINRINAHPSVGKTLM
ncbi:MAG: hypothetical protein PHE83_17405 [Opitutaceae bacterium]|nr:hypothetical protein [Opitutaceae bacterium]